MPRLSSARDRAGRRGPAPGAPAAIKAATRKASCADRATASASRAISSPGRLCRIRGCSSRLTASSLPGACRCTPKLTMAPNSAAPTDMPIMRMNICKPVRDTALDPGHGALDRYEEGGVAEPHANADQQRAGRGPKHVAGRLHPQQHGAAGHQAGAADRGGVPVRRCGPSAVRRRSRRRSS